MYSIDNIVTTSTCDKDGNLKLFSAFQMMQDCSEMWIDSEPTVKEFFEKSGMTQLLASRQVEIVRVPKYKERLKTVTTVFEVKPMFGFRNTFIYDAEGNVCYKTWSMGAFVDRTTGRLQRIPQDVLSSVSIEPKRDMTYGERRIILPKDAEFKVHELVAVTRNDIDYNGHMNNANYIRIANEYLPEGFKYNSVRVEFKIPARLGQSLVPQTLSTADGTFFVELSLDGKTSTLIEFK